MRHAVADAMARHDEEGERSARRFAGLRQKDREALLAFLNSL